MGVASRGDRREAEMSDLTSPPNLSQDQPRGGPARTRRPVYLDLLPPCNAGCPAGENIQGWLALVQAGEHERAWRSLVADNPMPATHGRVCYHVTVAVGHGKAAARHIDAFLRGRPAPEPVRPPVVGFTDLHPWYFGDTGRRAQPERDPAERVADFTEVVGGLDPAAATFEAGRCLTCGTCFECDGCLGSCPEDAVIKLGPGLRYQFDYARCTGCGTCFDQCPVHAIEMIPETK
jgi:Pyruvate/2-oxoacid:ferredoxin oxidoreductase delta subunit